MVDPIKVEQYRNALTHLMVPSWLSEVEGWISEGELKILAHAASTVPQGHRIVNLGSYRGKSALALAWGSKNGYDAPVYTIDPSISQKGITGEQYGPADFIALCDNIVRAPTALSELIHVVRLPGTEAARGFPSESVGLIFIDGLHDTSSVIADWSAWHHTLTNNSTVIYHDVNYESVQNAIDYIHQQGFPLQPLLRGGSIAVFQFTRNVWSVA